MNRSAGRSVVRGRGIARRIAADSRGATHPGAPVKFATALRSSHARGCELFSEAISSANLRIPMPEVRSAVREAGQVDEWGRQGRLSGVRLDEDGTDAERLRGRRG